MFKEMFRFRSGKDLESIKEGIKGQTGEDDFFGFEDAKNQEEFLRKNIREGFIEFDGDYVIVNADMA